MRNYAPLDRFISGLAVDVYPEVLSEPHLSITRQTIEALLLQGVIKPGMRVLDVGCGQGLALEHFARAGMQPVGVTLGVDFSVCRDKGFDVYEADQNFMECAEASFDFLWCRHVLEHSIAPLFTLTEYRRFVRPGGFVYVEVPAPDTSAHHETNKNHYSVLPLSSWHQLFVRAGFVIDRTGTIDFAAGCGPDQYWAFLLRARDASN